MSTPTTEPLDRGTQLAIQRTDLALDRSGMANERTLMAWIRTSLSMISFGFTIAKLEGSLLGSRKLDLGIGRTTDVRGVAYYLVLVGTLAMVVAGIQFWAERSRLVQQGLPRRFSLALLIAALLSVLGLFVFTDMASRVAL